jgi:hypothetical protein
VGVWKLQPQRPDSKLGTVQVECIEPLHDVSAWSRFVFRADGGRAVRYQVQVHERAPNGGRGKRLIQSDPLTEQVWIPSASDLAKLGDDIVWNVVVLDSSGDQQPGSDDVPVHRRR